ncbi:MAG: type II secretion system protein GspG [Candidatus Sumerlaeaceae bacterium]|nr:type II secretion system protein GspG [Candidatus Sumerlaeaceae bacterium]
MQRRAFTLIELLIVVAIIAILAAIAVPNFLEAQTRAKVSRAKSDMRSVATAIESYAVDNNAYPVPIGYTGPNEADRIDPATEPFEGFVPEKVSTPIAYITVRPLDTFRVKNPDEHPYDIPFHFSNQKFNAEALSEPNFMANLHQELTGNAVQIPWLIFSHGPDLSHQSGPPDADPPCLYDPTNGTVSIGDIYYFGAGGGIPK